MDLCHIESYRLKFDKAILGSQVDVLTLDGMVAMKVPPGTQPDSVLRLRGKGVRNASNPIYMWV